MPLINPHPFFMVVHPYVPPPATGDEVFAPRHLAGWADTETIALEGVPGHAVNISIERAKPDWPRLKLVGSPENTLRRWAARSPDVAVTERDLCDDPKLWPCCAISAGSAIAMRTRRARGTVALMHPETYETVADIWPSDHLEPVKCKYVRRGQVLVEIDTSGEYEGLAWLDTDASELVVVPWAASRYQWAKYKNNLVMDPLTEVIDDEILAKLQEAEGDE